MPCHRDVVEASHRDVAGYLDPAGRERVHHADGCLVIAAGDHPRQRRPPVGHAVDDPGAADGQVIAAPLGAVQERAACRGHLGLKGLVPGQAVRAVGVPADVGDSAVAMIDGQVPGELAHSGLVVAAHIGRRPGRDAGQRDNRDLPGQPVELGRVEQPVVQDKPVALARQREDSLARVMLADAHGPDQQVEAVPLSHDLDPAVDHVGELQALILVGEDPVAGEDQGPPDGHPHDFLEPGAQRSRRAVRREAKLGDRLENSFPGFLARVALSVQHPGDGCDRDAGGPCYVIDRRRGVRRVANLRHLFLRLLLSGCCPLAWYIWPFCPAGCLAPGDYARHLAGCRAGQPG